MFRDLLSQNFSDSPLNIFKKPLTRWGLKSTEINKIVEAMLPGICGTVFCNTPSGSGNLPAGLTYIGQLITHDIVPNSDPDSTDRISTPSLNLDSIFPNIELDQFCDRWTTSDLIDDIGKFKLRKLCKKLGVLHFDFPRSSCSHTKFAYAMIPDSRNDENVIVSQLATMLMRLHNVLIDHLHVTAPGSHRDRVKDYVLASKVVKLLFQQIVVEEYLVTLLPSDVYKYYFQQPHNPNFFVTNYENFAIPKEFSDGAFRFGHSMVRQSYRLTAGETTQLDELFRRNQFLRFSDLVDWTLFFPRLPNDLDKRPLHVDPFSNLKPNDFNDSASLGLSIAGGLGSVPISLKFRPLKYTLENSYSTRDWLLDSEVNKNFVRAQQVMKFKNIVIEDIDSSASLPTAGDIISSLESHFGKNNKRHPMLTKFGMSNLRTYRKRLDFSNLTGAGWHRIHISKIFLGIFSGKKKNLDLDSAPFWLFALKEAEQYPRKNSYAIDYKLGPLTSVILAEVLKTSIVTSNINYWNIDETEELGSLADLYQQLSSKPSMYNLISNVIVKEINMSMCDITAWRNEEQTEATGTSVWDYWPQYDTSDELREYMPGGNPNNPPIENYVVTRKLYAASGGNPAYIMLTPVNGWDTQMGKAMANLKFSIAPDKHPETGDCYLVAIADAAVRAIPFGNKQKFALERWEILYRATDDVMIGYLFFDEVDEDGNVIGAKQYKTSWRWRN
ncbi:MAG: peroxidase family protein [Pseudomonadota bacterium]